MARKKVEVVDLSVNGEIVAGKCCTACNEWKPLTEYHTSSDGSAGGKQPKCKRCKSELAKSSYKPSDNVIRIEGIYLNGVRISDAKRCKGCAILKPLSDYHNSPRGLGGKRAQCKECVNKKSQEWKDENRDKVRQYDRDRWANNTEKESARKVSKYDPVKASARYKRWAGSNKERVLIKNSKRAIRMKKLLNTFTVDEANKALIKFEHSCALTGEKSYVFDHFISLSTGMGGTHAGNIIPISEHMNSSKKDRNPFEWIKRPHIQEKILPGSFEKIVSYLAELNGMTTDEYETFVYNCYSI